LVGPVAHPPEDFRRQDHLLPPTAALGEPAADDLLGPALANLPAVGVGGVKEIEAQFEGLIHDGKRIGLAGLRAEVHRPEA
jgi:hypothetical protein